MTATDTPVPRSPRSSAPSFPLPPHGDPPCMPSCRAVGTIGWPVPYERGKPHASTVVCDSPSHQDEARAWVHGITGHAGVFRSFAEARAEARGEAPGQLTLLGVLA